MPEANIQVRPTRQLLEECQQINQGLNRSLDDTSHALYSQTQRLHWLFKNAHKYELCHSTMNDMYLLFDKGLQKSIAAKNSIEELIDSVMEGE